MLQITHKELSTLEATMLVVIDPQVEAPELLISGVESSSSVLLLNPLQDSIPQITTALTKGNYKTLHLVSHGSPGCLHLGKTSLTAENLPQYKQQLLEWGIKEILIYGCNVAAAPELLSQLHSLTGATIAASKQQVGKGNWHLEWQIGETTADSAFTPELKQKYQGTFVNATHTTIETGFLPYGVTVGNLNGDGTDDIVVSNEFSPNNQISVLLSNGSGGFGSTTFNATPRPDGVGIGDFDGDGAADDIAFSDNFFTDMSIMLGNGSGGFSSATKFTGSGGFRLAIEDFNGDGTDDIAAVNLNDVNLLLSNGSGGFSTSVLPDVGPGVTGVAVGDFDGDDNFDLAVSNQNSDDVSISLGDGSGGFSDPTNINVGSSATSLDVGDLDGDGEVDDLAVVRRLEDDVAVLLGDGAGGFGTQTNFDVGDNPNAVDIGDIDGDLKPDLAVANNSGNSVSVLLGDGAGSFAAQEVFAVGSQPRNIAIGDLDGDGKSDDIVTANRGSRNVSVLTVECFLTGTHILTEQGEVPVENLQIGNKVKTAEGKLETIKWVGKQTVEPNQVNNPLRSYPILIKVGALGNNLPHQDLYVSPDHAMFIDGLLINAGALVNELSIIKTEPNETFSYYHVELENHALLVAEGTTAESYLPQKENREQYDNCGEYEDLYPRGSNLMLWPMDYPRISSCNKVPRFVSQKLMAIAHQLFGQDLKLGA